MTDRPLQEWEYPEPDEYDDDVAETRACPNCAAEIYEDVDQCPACGEFVVHGVAPLSHWPRWIVVLGLVGMVAIMMTLIWGF